MAKKNSNFADDFEEPTALAYTDFSKPSPTIKGKDAERFIRHMEEINIKDNKNADRQMTLEEAKKKLSIYNMLYSHMEKEINELNNKIKNLKNYIDKING